MEKKALTKDELKYMYFRHYILSLEMQAYCAFYSFSMEKKLLPSFDFLKESIENVKASYNRTTKLLPDSYQKLLSQALFVRAVDGSK